MQATRTHEDVFDRSIDVQILRLRRKLETDPSVPRIIQINWAVSAMYLPRRSNRCDELRTERALSDGDLPRYKRSLIPRILECSGNPRIAGSLPVNISWERSMWIADQVDSEASAAELVHSLCFPQRLFAHHPLDHGTMRGRLLAQAGRAKEPRATTDRRKRGMKVLRFIDAPSRHSRVPAMEFFVEAFGCLRSSHGPTFDDPGELIDHHVPERDLNFAGRSRMSMGMKRHG